MNGNVVLQQISAIGAYDVTTCLEKMRLGDQVEDALRQLNLRPWGRSPTAAKEQATARPHFAHGRAGRPAKAPYPHPADDLPQRIPEEQLGSMGAIPEVAS